MTVETVIVPKKIVEEVKKRGLDLEELILQILSRDLELDPMDTIEARIELATQFLEKAKECIARGDAVQASEKLYRVAEECIKALAQLLQTPEYFKAVELNRWRASLLDEAAVTISERLNEPRVSDAWAHAYHLHVEGFHEARLSIKVVKAKLSVIEWLLEYTKRVFEERKAGKSDRVSNAE